VRYGQPEVLRDVPRNDLVVNRVVVLGVVLLPDRVVLNSPELSPPRIGNATAYRVLSENDNGTTRNGHVSNVLTPGQVT